MHRALRAAGLAALLLIAGRSHADTMTDHFVYTPAAGPWVDAHLAVDGVLQDLTAMGMLIHSLQHHVIQASWQVTPWFPVMGGGGGGLLLCARF